MFARRTCARCGAVLPLAETTGGRPSKFCGTACRVAAHRARSVPLGGFVTSPESPHPSARRGNETRRRPRLAADRAFKSASSPLRTGTGPTSAVRLQMSWRGPDGAFITVKPDPVWPGMWRVHCAGWTSDVVNISRARDAAMILAGVAE
jgi:hypothetical protein